MAEDVGDVGGKALMQVASLECKLAYCQVLFIITQSIAIASDRPAIDPCIIMVCCVRRRQRSMSSSRRFAELAEVQLQVEFQLEIAISVLSLEAKAVENSYRMAEFGCTGARLSCGLCCSYCVLVPK